MSAATGEKPATAAGEAKPGTAFRRVLHPGDHEFLPAALEILETPPSPVRMALLLIICALVVVALAWSWFGRIDVIASAQGKLQPTGRVQVVQPLVTGKVKAIHVRNGAHVGKGAVVVELDSSEAEADVRSLTGSLASMKAEILRRRAVLRMIAARRLAPMATIEWPDDIPQDIRAREQRVLESDIGRLAGIIRSLEAQREQKRAERARIEATIAAQESLIRTLNDRVEMRRTLMDKAAGTRSSLIDATQLLREQQTQLSIQKGQLKEAVASLDVLEKEIAKNYELLAFENSSKLSEIERQRDETGHGLEKARAKLADMTLRAPVGGVVQALSIVNIGQVVTSGEQVMRIVPEGEELEIEAYVLNRDIGFVKAGQDAAVKIDSFPFTRFGTVDATVTRVSADAIPQPDVQQIEGNPAASTRPTGPGGTPRVQNLVFPVTLKLRRASINVDGRPVALVPGMTVNVEIKTGSRRILEYVFSPLVEVASQSLRER